MSVVRRKKENIDMLEHAMMGVRMTDDGHQIVSFGETKGIMGSGSGAQVDVRETNPYEREVVVTMPKMRKKKTA
jgi:hypothetical protein